MIGKVGTILGEGQVNISTMQVSRDEDGGERDHGPRDRPAGRRRRRSTALRAIPGIHSVRRDRIAVIYLARHGETTWNLAGRYQGRLESALSALGVRQGIALAEYFVQRAARDEAVPARVDLEPAAALHGDGAVQRDASGPRRRDRRRADRDRARHVGGALSRRARAQRFRALSAYGARIRRTFPSKTGETLPEVAARWDAFAAGLLARPDEELLVVTHDAVVRVALLALEGRPLDDFWQMPVENAAFARIERSGDGLSLVEACHTDHLADLRASVTGQAL